MINMNLVDGLGITDETFLEIKKGHCYRSKLEDFMSKLDPDTHYELKMLKEFYVLWTENEYDLQELWGFPRDASYHRNYNIPHCICPVMDNDELQGFPSRIITEGCPYHG